MRISKVFISTVFMVFLAVGCSTSNQTSSTKGITDLTVYTTIYPFEYAVEQIGGDTLTAESIYPPGVDAHTYEPTSKDMTAIAESDAFIYLGAGMEGFAESAADALASQDVRLVEIGKHDELFHKSELAHEHAHEGHDHSDEHVDHGHHHHGDHDPHIWLDPIRMVEVAEIIKGELIALNPNEKDTYNKNYNALKEKLIALDDRFKKVLGTKENHYPILVAHAAYGYWEDRYGIEQISISGLSPSSEPSQQELTEIIDQAKKYNLNYVLYEQNTSNRVSEVVQEQIGAKALHIHNLSVLTEKDIAKNEDYISLMENNLEVLEKAIK